MTTTREQRLAAMRARRDGWTPTVEQTIRVADLRPGDWLVSVPTQERIRGLVANTTVAAVEHDISTWRVGRMPVSSRRITVGAVVVNYPETFRCVVRRADPDPGGTP
jgi:hypothetical protein